MDVVCTTGWPHTGPAIGEAADLFSTMCITTAEEAQEFSVSLKRNTTLPKVTLSGSTFGVQGMHFLAQASQPHIRTETMVWGFQNYGCQQS